MYHSAGLTVALHSAKLRRLGVKSAAMGELPVHYTAYAMSLI